MSNAQKPNKHRRNKSNHATTTKGPRGNARKYRHGKGKSVIKSTGKKR